jgi:ketosteroid isomerase-like protein
MFTRSVRQGYAAASRRDLDRLLLAFDPRIELHIAGGMVPLDLGPVFHGYDGYRRAWEGLWDVAEDAYLEPNELLDFGDRFLVAAHMRGHGSGSGAPFDQPFFQAFFLERGLIVQQHDFPTRAEALDALGLSE